MSPFSIMFSESFFFNVFKEYIWCKELKQTSCFFFFSGLMELESGEESSQHSSQMVLNEDSLSSMDVDMSILDKVSLLFTRQQKLNTFFDWKHLQMSKSFCYNHDFCLGKGKKHCWISRKCWLPAFSSLAVRFLKLWVVWYRVDCGYRTMTQNDDL